jgi:hypothetical protein
MLINKNLWCPPARISKRIGPVIHIHRHTTPHLSRTTHRRWIDRKTPWHPCRRMTKQSWLHHFLDRFSRPLHSHRSSFWLCLLLVGCVEWPFHIFSKHLIESRANSAELGRRLSSVLLPSICFTMLWSDGLRSLLLLVVSGPSSLHSWTVYVCPGLFGLSARTVRRTQDMWLWSGVRSCLPPGASGLSFVRSLPSNHSTWHIWRAKIPKDDIFIFAFISRTWPN